ncbi:uncharacterized protein LOC132033242 isoform X2 [Lycium ferocissimum]|uniref:uncharacterized protein LOC132033242 isoform X2 n=1 Tax=Lycium ferocissimum TaxID=112874 RepID=UPI002814C891|nr:uncharacterized protein LOC132033242 isoform X2 [Lycium ferocissimum]
MGKDEEFPVILGRNIGISSFQGLSLQIRFNSTIHINPAYPQAFELINWAKTNTHMLSSYASANFSATSTSLSVTPTQQQVIPIAEISTQTSIGVFYVQAEMFISNDLQKFCVLECSGYKQKKRTKERREFACTKCNRQTTLVPRCTFQIDLIDGRDSITTVISGDIAEKMLSMIAEHIFEITLNQLLPIDHVHKMLSVKLFLIQLKKSSWRSSNDTQTTVSILSYVEREPIFPPSINQRNTKKK